MHLRSKLRCLFLVILVIASIVEASKRRKHKKKAPVPSTTIIDSSVGLGREIPVQYHSESRPDLEKTKDSRASVGEASSSVGRSEKMIVPSVVFGRRAITNVDAVEHGFRKAVDEEDFVWLNANRENWWGRANLLEDVIAKGADVTARIIQNVIDARQYILVALFEKGSDKVIDGCRTSQIRRHGTPSIGALSINADMFA